MNSIIQRSLCSIAYSPATPEPGSDQDAWIGPANAASSGLPHHPALAAAAAQAPGGLPGRTPANRMVQGGRLCRNHDDQAL